MPAHSVAGPVGQADMLPRRPRRTARPVATFGRAGDLRTHTREIDPPGLLPIIEHGRVRRVQEEIVVDAETGAVNDRTEAEILDMVARDLARAGQLNADIAAAAGARDCVIARDHR